MALFARRRRRAHDDSASPEPAEAPRAPRSVGTMLREERGRQGGSLEQIGAALRIRPAYLEAIEEGRYERLPGATYAQGFVRAYAEHLDLDGAELVRRYKAETAGLEASHDLSFPMPLPDRSGRPGGAMLLAALIIAACSYAVWYYMSSGDRSRPERVAAVPAELAPPAPPPPTPRPASRCAGSSRWRASHSRAPSSRRCG